MRSFVVFALPRSSLRGNPAHRSLPIRNEGDRAVLHEGPNNAEKASPPMWKVGALGPKQTPTCQLGVDPTLSIPLGVRFTNRSLALEGAYLDRVPRAPDTP